MSRNPSEPATPAIPVLKDHIDPMFRGYDLNYKDVDRARQFIKELEESIAESWLREAAKLPGWNDGPEYAPHPVAPAEVNEDEVV